MRLDPPGLTGPPPPPSPSPSSSPPSSSSSSSSSSASSAPATRRGEEEAQNREEVTSSTDGQQAGNNLATASRLPVDVPDVGPRRRTSAGRIGRREERPRRRRGSVAPVDVLAYTAFSDDDDAGHVADGDGAQDGATVQYDRGSAKAREKEEDEEEEEEEDLAKTEEKEDTKREPRETTTCLSVPGGYLGLRARHLPSATAGTEISVVGDCSPKSEAEGQAEGQAEGEAKTREVRRPAVRAGNDDDDGDGGGDGKRGSDNTARFPKPIIRRREYVRRLAKQQERRGLLAPDGGGGGGGGGGKRQSRGKSYGLFFVLYLLAWPLLCTTSPSGQMASAFAQKSPLAHGDGHVHRQPHDEQHHRNASLPQSLSASTVAHQHHDYQQQQQQQQQDQPQQQQVQGHEAAKGKLAVRGHHHHRQQADSFAEELVEDFAAGLADDKDERYHYQSHQGVPEAADSTPANRNIQSRKRSSSSSNDNTQNRNTVKVEYIAAHPYNEYTWEVNQINPWLSACDLAGPAPADLQGSCGPPEVPKNCPVPCARAHTGEARFVEVIERLDADEARARARQAKRRRRKWKKKRRRKMKKGGPIDDRIGDRIDGRIDRANPDDDDEEEEGEEGEEEQQEVVVDELDEEEDDEEEEDSYDRAGSRTAPEQCLFYLEESHKRDVCRDDFGRANARSFLTPRENRYRFVSGLRLRHCCEHAVVNALAPGKAGPLEDVLNGGRKCVEALDKLLIVDKLAARLHCEFEEVLARYDCAQPYSVIHNCTHCKEAYRKWVCSSLVPYFAHGGPDLEPSEEEDWSGTRLRPCRSFCQSVEQRCPYLLPGDRAPAYPTQYAGEPTFLCRDPNIPETGSQAARALHSSEDGECCFRVCSEERPGSGICTNCTLQELKERRRHRAPPTAPQCEITPIQSGSTGDQYPFPGVSSGDEEDPFLASEDADSLTPVDQSATSTVSSPIQQGASFCGGGGVGSMTSSSSGSSRSRPSVVLRLLLVYWSFTFLLRALSRVTFFGEVPGIRRRWLAVTVPTLVTIFERICRGWSWWSSWRRSSSRHFRWKWGRKKGEGGFSEPDAGGSLRSRRLSQGSSAAEDHPLEEAERGVEEEARYEQCRRVSRPMYGRGLDRFSTKPFVLRGKHADAELVCLETFSGVSGRVRYVGHGLNQFLINFAVVDGDGMTRGCATFVGGGRGRLERRFKVKEEFERSWRRSRRRLGRLKWRSEVDVIRLRKIGDWESSVACRRACPASHDRIAVRGRRTSAEVR